MSGGPNWVCVLDSGLPFALSLSKGGQAARVFRCEFRRSPVHASTGSARTGFGRFAIRSTARRPERGLRLVVRFTVRPELVEGRASGTSFSVRIQAITRSCFDRLSTNGVWALRSVYGSGPRLSTGEAGASGLSRRRARPGAYATATFTGGVLSLNSRVTKSSGKSKAPPKPASICEYSGRPLPSGGCATGGPLWTKGGGFL